MYLSEPKTMDISFRVLSCPKTGRAEETNEDAFIAAPDRGIFAVSDGATQSPISSLWSRILVEHAGGVGAPLSDDAFELQWWLRQPQARFAQDAPSLEAVAGDLRAKYWKGSHATLAVFEVHALLASKLIAHWYTYGDSCVFLFSNRGLELCEPLRRSDEFNSTPPLLPTRGFWRFRNAGRHLVVEIPYKGSAVVLATDAVAKWILQSVESGHSRVYDELREQSTESWASWIEEKRRNAEVMEDDDSTAVLIEFGDTGLGSVGSLMPAPQPGINERRNQLLQAIDRRDYVDAAIIAGDPAVWNGLREILDRLRTVADAHESLLMALSSPGVPERDDKALANLRDTWHEVCRSSPRPAGYTKRPSDSRVDGSRPGGSGSSTGQRVPACGGFHTRRQCGSN